MRACVSLLVVFFILCITGIYREGYVIHMHPFKRGNGLKMIQSSESHICLCLCLSACLSFLSLSLSLLHSTVFPPADRELLFSFSPFFFGKAYVSRPLCTLASLQIECMCVYENQRENNIIHSVFTVSFSFACHQLSCRLHCER